MDIIHTRVNLKTLVPKEEYIKLKNKFEECEKYLTKYYDDLQKEDNKITREDDFKKSKEKNKELLELIRIVIESYNPNKINNYNVSNNIINLIINTSIELKKKNEKEDKMINFLNKNSDEGNHWKKWKIVYSNEDKYYGVLKEGKANEYGIYTLANGDKYEGEYKDNKRNGIGKETNSKRDIYEGGNRNGYGIFIWQMEINLKESGKLRRKMDMEWKLIQMEINMKENLKMIKKIGYGKFTLKNGEEYEGEFKDNNKNGYGLFTWENGEEYEGEYKDDLRNGYGIYI